MIEVQVKTIEFKFKIIKVQVKIIEFKYKLIYDFNLKLQFQLIEIAA